MSLKPPSPAEPVEVINRTTDETTNVYEGDAIVDCSHASAADLVQLHIDHLLGRVPESPYATVAILGLESLTFRVSTAVSSGNSWSISGEVITPESQPVALHPGQPVTTQMVTLVFTDDRLRRVKIHTHTTTLWPELK